MDYSNTTNTLVPMAHRPKVMLATRRRRLGSMPSRFAQTDEELQMNETRRLARTSNSLQVPGFSYWDTENSENARFTTRSTEQSPGAPYRDSENSENVTLTQTCTDIRFNLINDNDAVCHSPDQSPVPWGNGYKVSLQRNYTGSRVGYNFFDLSSGKLVRVMYTPLNPTFIYSKTGVSRSSPIFCFNIFAPKQRLWVLVGTAEYVYTQSMF